MTTADLFLLSVLTIVVAVVVAAPLAPWRHKPENLSAVWRRRILAILNRADHPNP